MSWRGADRPSAWRSRNPASAWPRSGPRRVHRAHGAGARVYADARPCQMVDPRLARPRPAAPVRRTQARDTAMIPSRLRRPHSSARPTPDRMTAPRRLLSRATCRADTRTPDESGPGRFVRAPIIPSHFPPATSISPDGDHDSARAMRSTISRCAAAKSSATRTDLLQPGPGERAPGAAASLRRIRSRP